jgi:hypothetical protein
MVVTLAAGFIFLAVIVGSGMGLWWALNYNPSITIALVALYGVTQFGYTQIKYPKQNIRGLWILFWFDNEWYKLVLLITGMFAFLTWS